MKKLIFDEINCINLIFILICKIFFKEIFFVKISKTLRNKTLINLLEKLNVIWFSYQKISIKDQTKEYSRITFTSQWSEFCFAQAKKYSNKIWDKILDKDLIKKKYLIISLYWELTHTLDNEFEIIEISNLLKKKGEIVYVWLTNNKVTNDSVSKYKDIKILTPKIFSVLLLQINFFTFFLKKIFIIFKSRINLKNFFTYKKKINRENKISENQIIFFPHMGVVSKNSSKLYFYEQVLKEPCDKKKITHIEWNKQDLSPDSVRFYSENKIPVYFWNIEFYKFSKKRLKIIITFLIKKIFNTDFFLLKMTSFILIGIEYHLGRIEKFTNAKVALIGNEYSFPVTLASALKFKNIKMFAFQKKLSHGVTKKAYILDKYFVLGNKSKQDLSKTNLNQNFSIFTGNNLNDVVFIKNKIDKEKILKQIFIKSHRYKKKCIVFDSPSKIDWYDNGRQISNNWKFNLEFLEIIHNVVNNNSNIFFIIKNKREVYSKIKYYAKKIKQLKKLKNVCFIPDNKKNYDKILTNDLVNFCDFSISRHSSIVDDMLSLNKPVFIYDGPHNNLISSCIPYSDNILFSNYKNLEKKINNVLKNYNKVNIKMNIDRKYLFDNKSSNKMKIELSNLRKLI